MLKVENKAFMFVGPTLYGVPSNLLASSPFNLRPPIKRGDLEQLVNNTPVGKIILVDGTFHQYPSVGHAEIFTALKNGWEVWGLSSMGAIRACEMHLYGMKGFGAVYSQFVADENFSDDEVTLIHGVDSPFVPITEPLIHIRAFINRLVDLNCIKLSLATSTIEELKSIWYGFRTLKRVRTMLLAQTSDHAKETILQELLNFEKYRLKTLDLIDFINGSPCYGIPS